MTKQAFDTPWYWLKRKQNEKAPPNTPPSKL